MLIHANDALRGEGRVSAALGYYRALFTGLPGALSPSPVPTLYFHGARDGAISPNFREEPEAYMAEGSRRLVLPSAGHFLHLEQPELVIPELLQFLDPR
jgi:pimeloyl-ACP methyl ester carboxylesterase